jgi:hypothetical protein
VIRVASTIKARVPHPVGPVADITGITADARLVERTCSDPAETHRAASLHVAG